MAQEVYSYCGEMKELDPAPTQVYWTLSTLSLTMAMTMRHSSGRTAPQTNRSTHPPEKKPPWVVMEVHCSDPALQEPTVGEGGCPASGQGELPCVCPEDTLSVAVLLKPGGAGVPR